jgi:Prenyltransferase and squalene oxidase repeat
MPTGFRLHRIPALTAMLAVVTGVIAGLVGPAALAGTAAGPNLVKGSAYLVSPANLIGGHYYGSFGHTADFGLTIDGAFALAATGDEDQALKKIVSFLADGGRDAAGKTVNYWTGIGTRYASGGAIAKEALLAEVAGDSPRDFGGRNLIAALDASLCLRAGSGGAARCPAAGSYGYASSVFDQALGVMAQLRAGQLRQAAAPVRYLESLQHADGSFASLIPGTGGDVDSTAMAVMALALVPGHAAAADVRSGVAWIAGRQERDGGFPGAGGDSVNSAGLAIQALTLRRAGYRSRIAAAEQFLAHEQNANGGFNAYAGGQPGSNLRASTQAVGGAVGTPFGSLRRSLNQSAAGGSGLGRWTTYLILISIGLVLAAVGATAGMRQRHRRGGVPRAGSHRADPVGRPGP